MFSHIEEPLEVKHCAKSPKSREMLTFCYIQAQQAETVKHSNMILFDGP
jgi:hypothetical protein